MTEGQHDWLVPAPRLLKEAIDWIGPVSATPSLDAELIMAAWWGLSRGELLLKLDDYTGSIGLALQLMRRAKGEPVAYITGTRGFWTIDLDVTPDVLIPRPDSETLVQAAVEYFKSPPARVLDLGTGSGALLLAALDQWPGATGIGIDASEAAVSIGRANAERIAPGRAEMRLGNWADGLDETFDLILCNPPYIEDGAPLPPDVRDHEPASALFAGADGLDCYREIIPALPRLLAPGGMIAVEIGSAQAEPVSALFRAAGLSPQIRHDLASLPRAVVHFALGSATPAR